MGVSMTSGTNWSNANLITITPDDKAAAKELELCGGNCKSRRKQKRSNPEIRIDDAGCDETGIGSGRSDPHRRRKKMEKHVLTGRKV